MDHEESDVKLLIIIYAILNVFLFCLFCFCTHISAICNFFCKYEKCQIDLQKIKKKLQKNSRNKKRKKE